MKRRVMVFAIVFAGCGAGDTVKTEMSPVTVNAPKGANKQTLMELIQTALNAAAKNEMNQSVKMQLMQQAMDQAGVMHLACGAMAGFTSGEDGSTEPFVNVTHDGQKNACITITNVVVYNGPPDDMLSKHEAGHAYINDELAKRLGPKLADKYRNDPMADDKIAQGIIDAQNQANAAYDTATMNGTQGDQMTAAQTAVNDAVNNFH